ncbi:MAG TPA: MFS transporter [Steroidobacteraceae bacterium]|nr:MFS transporter [Steroidobacteraceae bacterium]
MQAPVPAAPDLGQLIDDSRWSPLQKWVLVLGALAFTADGLANQVLGLAIPALIRDWRVPGQAFAAVAALGLIGVALGTTFGGLLGDRLGRRRGLTGSVLLFGLMTVASARVHTLTELMALRFIGGLGIGGAIPNGAALISEFTPLRRRSVAIAIGMLFIPVGGVVAGGLATGILPQLGWRGLFLVAGAVTLAIGLLFAAVLPESPRFLVRFAERRSQLLELLRRCGLSLDPRVQLTDAVTRERTPLKALFGHGMLTDTLALWVAFFFGLLASYTLFSWVPTMLAGQGFSLSATSIGTTSFNIGGMIGSIVGGWLIEKVGSRASVLALAAGTSLGALALGLMPLNPQHGLGTALIALTAEGFFLGGFHNGLYTLAAFLYPPFVRGTGVGAAAGVGRIGAVVSAYTGVLALELAGKSGYFIVIAVAAAIALLATAVFRQHVARSAGKSGQADEATPVAAASQRH